MSSYKLSKERLLEVLIEAYEAGWSGPLDLADSLALSLIEDKLDDARCVDNSNQLTLPFEQASMEIDIGQMGEVVAVTQDTTTQFPEQVLLEQFPEQMLLNWNYTSTLE